jgi:hypothetical protein
MAVTMPEPKRRAPSDRLGRHRRREGEWATRQHRLSERLTRFMFTSQQAVNRDYKNLQVAEARMADIVFAASAIETSYLRTRRVTAALARTAMWRPREVANMFDLNSDLALSDRARKLIAMVPDAYYDFHAMLWWGRSLLFRVDGDWAGEKVKGVLVNRHLTGLVHYLPRSEARLVHAARDRLVHGAFADVRYLADYSLHAFAVPRPMAMMTLQADGTYALPLPDRLGRRLKVAEVFTYSEKRHIGTEAESLWLGVQEFMGDLFAILEQAQLRREEALAGDVRKVVRLLRRELMPPRARRTAKGPTRPRRKTRPGAGKASATRHPANPR